MEEPAVDDERERKAAEQAERLARYFADDGPGDHGTSKGYDVGCRCDPCRLAHNEKSRNYKRKRRLRSP